MRVNGYLEALRSRVSGRRRTAFFLVVDAILLTLSLLAAAGLRFDGSIPPELSAQLPLVVAISLAVKLPVFASQRLYWLSWSQVGLEDMLLLVRAVSLGSVAFLVAILVIRNTGNLAGFPRTVLLLDYIITLHAIGAFRMGRRIYQHFAGALTNEQNHGRSALIVGAGAAGGQLARSLRQTPSSDYRPIGFVDDDPRKLGTVIYGLPVLGNREGLPNIVRENHIQAVLIAMPTAPSRVIRNVVTASREAGAREVRILPGLESLLNGQISFTDLRDVQLTDLLGRGIVQIQTSAIEQWLQGRRVLVTGAGGSIGSELCRQLVRFQLSELVVLDMDESGLFWIDQELQRLGYRATEVIADVRDDRRMQEILLRVRPNVVFHAAAYKHVGLMERHPEEAVVTNIFGTISAAEASLLSSVEKFVLISTDKAVNPTSVMGATKRLAEEVCLTLNGRGPTQFIAVRFGNVLGSRGSVIPLFQEHIHRGEPLTVRGPNMRRYLMATSEAVSLVLQAGAMGKGGEVFVLDMGEPVRILDLAKDMIRLVGLEPEKDVPIVFADPEPGEKEHEDFLMAEEGIASTRHDRIFVAHTTFDLSGEELAQHIDTLRKHVDARDVASIVETLRILVPTYTPSEALLGRVNAPQPSRLPT